MRERLRPLAMAPRLAGGSQQDVLERRGERVMTVQGRLKPGVSVAQAAAEAKVIAQQLATTYQDTNRSCSLAVDTDLQSRLKQNPFALMAVVFLLGLAAVVLLIACANVMNLMLSRAGGRSREIAVRLAIGAGRGRLIRQLLTESLLIALLGGGLGVLVAGAGMDLFSQIRFPTDTPVALNLKLDPRVLLFTICASMASALLFGLAPAVQSTKLNLVPALKSERAEGGRGRRLLGRSALAIAQVAGALVLLVFATQAYRGASILLSSPAGFRTDHLLTATFNPTLARYTADETREFYRQLLEKARGLNGVKSAALSQAVPIVPGGGMTRVVPEGVQLPQGTEAIGVVSNTVTEGYFGTAGVPIMQGREFQVTDTADSPRVAIVEEVFEERNSVLRVLTKAIGGMGLLGLALALVGLYGLMSYSVSLRVREIGIRMAIGADRVGVLRMVLKRGMALASIGVGIGLVLCLLANRAVTAAGVAAFNLPLLAMVAAALAGVAALGAYVPARRASLVDPISVLRQE